MEKSSKIVRPQFRKDQEIPDIEARIWRDIQRLKEVSSKQRFTFFMNNLRTNLKQSGHWLDGSNRGE
jgi:hypothetical protein